MDPAMNPLQSLVEWWLRFASSVVGLCLVWYLSIGFLMFDAPSTILRQVCHLRISNILRHLVFEAIQSQGAFHRAPWFLALANWVSAHRWLWIQLVPVLPSYLAKGPATFSGLLFRAVWIRRWIDRIDEAQRP